MLGIKSYLKDRMIGCFDRSVEYLATVVDEHLASRPTPRRVLDVGISDGVIARNVRDRCRSAYELHGLDVYESESAIALCDRFVACDLEKRFPCEDASYDVVYSNQVIEHIVMKSHFVEECARVLAPGGRLVIATENISSIDNIASLLFGQEPLSQHTSEKFHSNSFLSPHFMREYGGAEADELASHMLGHGAHHGHKNVPSLFGLVRIVEHEGLRVESKRGFGHATDLVERLLPFQCRVIVVCASKR
jgi:SAM-dependent methyltransferase